MSQGRLARGLAFAALGVVAGFGHAPLGWWIVTVLALAAFVHLYLRAADFKTALWHTWAFGVGYFGFSLRWIISPFMVDPARDGWMAPFGIAFMAVGGAVFWMVAAGFAYRLRPRSGALFVVFLAGAEALRSLILTGFPWALIGHVVIDTPLAQLAAFVGPHGLTLLVCLLAWAVQALMRHGTERKAGLVGIIATAAIYPVLDPGPARASAPNAPIVRLVQPNAAQDEKWDPVMSRVFFERMLTFSGQGDVPDLIVWPETAIADLLNYAQDAFAQASDVARGAPIILGINRRDGDRYYNSFVLLGRGGLVQSIYDKEHLVPFGEYVPGGELLAQFGLTTFAPSHAGGFSAGYDQSVMEVPGIGNVRPLICYEGIFAEEIGTATRPEVLVLITNDAWFGKAAGPYQHLAQARLRAIEQGLPMVRAANTGVSAIIDAKGRLLGAIPLNTPGWLDLPLPDPLAATIYTRSGDMPALTVILLLALVCVRRRTA